jgi:hypothetical protein
MKRKLLSKSLLKQTALMVPAAALMLGAAQAGTTIGINYTMDWTPYNYSYETTGFNVTAKAFGVDVANWANIQGKYGSAVADTTVFDLVTVVSTAANTWSSGIGNLNPDPIGPGAVTPGDNEVTWSYLDDSSPGWSVALSGLNTAFPNGYVVQTIGVPYLPPAPNVNITDSATFTNLLTYTDLGNGTAISVESPALMIDAITIAGAPRNGSHRSTLAGFILTDKPVVSQKPVGGVFNSGSSISLSAGVVGIPPISYQWYTNGVPILGATKTNYSKAGATSSDSAAYTLVASNAYGLGTSVVAQVTVLLSPTVISDLPGAATNYLSMNERFAVIAGGQEPLSYQWFKGTSRIPSATNAALSLTNLQTLDAGSYKVVITNSVGSITSSVASLTVLDSQPPYDGFSYPAGSLTGQGGGIGWNGLWVQEAGYNGDHSVFTPATPWRGGISELVSTGGAVQMGASGSADFEDIRNLLTTLGGASCGTLYMSFVSQVTNAGWGGIELVKDGTAALFLGSCWYFSPWGWGTRAAPDATAPVPASTLALLVYRFDFTPTNTAVRLYVNPSSLSAEPSTADASGTEALVAFNEIRIVTHNSNPNGFFDEFRIGGTWAAVTPHILRTDASFTVQIVPGGLIQDTKPVGTPHSGYNYGAAWTASVTDSAVPTPVTRTGVELFSAATGSQITIPTNSAFNSPSGTICFWMLANAPLPGPGTEGAILFDRRTTNGTVIVLNDAGAIFWQGQAGAQNALTAGYLPDGNWHHVAVTYGQTTNDTIAIYIDGALSGSTPVANAWSWPMDQEIEIGQSHDSYWKRLDGDMDDFRIYNRVLSDTEISQVYTSGALVDPAALKVQYTFNSAIYGQSLVWPYGTLISSPSVAPGATWTPVPGAVSPMPFETTQPTLFYRAVGTP